MNIVYLSVLDGRPWAGPTYSVPKQVEAQAKVENLSFLTHDELIPGYEEKCIIPV